MVRDDSRRERKSNYVSFTLIKKGDDIDYAEGLHLQGVAAL